MYAPDVILFCRWICFTGDVQARIRQIRLEEKGDRLEVELSQLKAKVEKQNETITRILEGETTQWHRLLFCYF